MNYTAPMFFEPNRIKCAYQGGRLLNEIQGISDKVDTNLAEEWLASTEQISDLSASSPGVGLSVVKPQGPAPGLPCTLKKMLMCAPANLLGSEFVSQNGADLGFKCKLMDIADIPHDDVEVSPASQGHSGAFFVLATREINGKLPKIWIREIDGQRELIFGVLSGKRSRKARAISTVNPGDTIFIPAGLRSSFAPGLFVLDVEVSKSNSVAHAISHRLTDDISDADLVELLKPRDMIVRRSDEGATLETVGPALTSDFGIKRIEVVGRYHLKSQSPFCLVFCASGSGRVRWASGGCEIVTGQYFFMPYTVPWVEMLAYNKMCLLVVEPGAIKYR